MMTVRDFEDYIINGIEVIFWSIDEDKYISEVVDLNDLEKEDSPLLDLEVDSIEGYANSPQNLQLNVYTKEND